MVGLHGVTSDYLAESSLGRPGVGPRGHQLWQLDLSVDLVGTVRTVQQIPFRKTVPPTVPTKEPLICAPWGMSDDRGKHLEISTFTLPASHYLLLHTHAGSHVLEALMGHV